ncbi:MAG: S8 family serine peptidase [Candidatus Krumholzibacteria bacterium]|nr:S8 family serine peptidase [Candidatus Krumholzibacteria bacterium]
MRRLLSAMLAILAMLFVGCSDSVKPTIDHQNSHPDEMNLPKSGDGLTRYIVVFADHVGGVPDIARQMATVHRGRVHFVYEHAIKGFCVTVPERAAGALSRNPNVVSVELDRPARLAGTGWKTQTSGAPWGLDRIDQRDLPLDSLISFDNTGAGINIYIIDSGVRIAHNEFGGRAFYVPSPDNGDFVGDGHGSAEDCFGHGTHVAGIAASDAYGVAKEATIWAARVTDCVGWGYASMAIAAVDWITANGQLPAVVNMSLGYGDVPSLSAAVENSVAAGFNYAVAAGNQTVPFNACGSSPANSPSALTVGATSSIDIEAPWSAFGPCVDLLAPGVDIISTWHTGNGATSTESGTSAAAPHVAGCAALFLAANPGAAPDDVTGAILASATADRLTLHSLSTQGGTPNLLLYTDLLPPPPNDPPSAAFGYETVNMDCIVDASPSEDSDGSIVSYLWDFGDGQGGFGMTASCTYSEAGTFTVALTVLDNLGAANSTTHDVTVPGEIPNDPPGGSFAVCSNVARVIHEEESPEIRTEPTQDFETATGMAKVSGAESLGIMLSIKGHRESENMVVDLNWAGTSALVVDIYRDGQKIAVVENAGAYSDLISRRGQWLTYQVCDGEAPRPGRDRPTELE